MSFNNQTEITMTFTARLFAVSTLAALSAFSAHADEFYGSERALNFNSTRSAADVRAEARMPVRITNGGTGYIGLTNSAVSRDAIKAQAAAAVRSGQISQGEIGLI